MDMRSDPCHRRGTFFAAFCFLIVQAATSGATEYYVDGVSGSDTYDGSTWTDAKATVAAGLALAVVPDDIVNIAPFTYTIDATLVPDANNIIIQGNNFGEIAEPDTVVLSGDVNGDDGDVDLLADPCGLKTLYDGGFLSDNKLVFNLSGLPGITIKDLTITKSIGVDGGAVNTSSNARATFQNVHFVQNWATDDGGALALALSANLTLNDCRFMHNACFDNGGTIFAEGTSTLTVSNCEFGPAQGHDSCSGILTIGMPTVRILDSYFHDLYNIRAAELGGAIHARFSDTGSKSITIERCVFENCTAAYYGAAVYLQAMYSLTGYTAHIDHCLAYDCSNYTAGKPAGVFWCENKASGACSMTVNFANCTIAHNDSTTEGAALGVWSNGQPVTVNLKDTIIWGNTGSISEPNQIWYNTSQTKVTLNMDYCCLYQPGSALPAPKGIGNLFVDPNFADPDNGDFHLKSQAGRWDPGLEQWVMTDTVTSPCIDTGNPGAPLGEEPADPNNLRINMGYYGRTDQAGKTPVGWAILPDINNDYQVNLADFGIFKQWWRQGRQYYWSEPSYHSELETGDPNIIFSPHLTSNQMTIYYHRYNTETRDYAIIKANRTSTSGTFTIDRELTELDPNNAAEPWLSEDGQRLYFTGEDEIDGERYIKMAQWNDNTSEWEIEQTFTELHVGGYNERSPCLTGDELTIYWASNNTAGQGRDDIWRASRASTDDPFETPVNVSELNTTGDETSPFVSSDNLTIYFASDRSSPTWKRDIFHAERLSDTEPFSEITIMEDFADPDFNETDPFVAADTQKILLKIDKAEESGIYETDWTYNVFGVDGEHPADLNHDEFVDLSDYVLLFDQWLGL